MKFIIVLTALAGLASGASRPPTKIATLVPTTRKPLVPSINTTTALPKTPTATTGTQFFNMTTDVFTTQKECGARADIIFVIDSSTSVLKKNFQTTLQFLQAVVLGFTIGPDDVLIGVVKYSGSPTTEFPLNKYVTSSQLLARINNIAYTGGGTMTGDALGEMMKQFDKKYGDRANAVNIGIVITDGQSGEVKKNADLAKASGVQMFAIGVGPNVNQRELLEIASGPSFVFNATDYSSLNSIKSVLTNKTCAVATKPTTAMSTVATTQDCRKEAADIILALDSSGSIGLQNYVVLKQFVTSIVDSLNISTDGVRVGVIHYSEAVTEDFPLNKFFNKALMKAFINLIPYDSAGTKTDDALKYMREKGFTAANGARLNVPKLAIVITDGQSTYPKSTEYQAKLLKAEQVKVFAIGVGAKVDSKELEYIASGPNYVFKVENFQGLSQIKQSLETLACEAILETRPTIVTTQATTSGGCVDATKDCDLFGRAVCTDYAPWAKDNCPCFCGFCACTGPKEPCVDNRADCTIYGDTLCVDPGYRSWVKSNCRKYCGMCTVKESTLFPPTTTTTTPRPCIDTIPNCAAYGTASCTDPFFKDWVEKNCRKHCQRC